MRRLLIEVFVSVIVLAVAAPAALADEVVESAGGGGVDVTFAYDRADYEYSNLRLSVLRAGALVYAEPVEIAGCAEPFCRPGGFGESDSVAVADLEADREPEVLLDINTGAAHCCSLTQVLRWNGAGYQATEHDWRDPGYALEDLDGDGRPEFHSADARFAYRFTFFAASAMPVSVWRYEGGRFSDVTARFGDVVRKDSARWYKVWRGIRRDRGAGPLGPLAAWAADEYRLGHRAAVRRQLRSALKRGWLRGVKGWPRGESYIRELDRFLTRSGYRA